MRFKHWWLQLFAGEGVGGDGTSSGGESGGTESGVTPADAGQGQGETLRDRLRRMGVPEDKLKNRAYDAPAAKGTPTAQQAEQPDAAAQTQEQEQGSKPTWNDLMKDPDYKAEASKMVQKRIGKYKATADAMDAMAPAFEMLAKHYGLDAEHMDYTALSKALLEDDTYYQQRAVDMGVSVDVAKRLEAAERLEEARRRDMEMNEQQRAIQQHIAGLYEQGEALKAKYPGINIDVELQNDQFARLTAPGVGVSVEDAYFIVHRDELMQAARQATIRNTSQTIQAGQNRPNEAGQRKSGNAPAKDASSISHMPKEKRDELIRRMQNGERVTAADILAMA